MSGLKRLCMVVFVLACALSLASLGLTWFGPWTRQASALFGAEPYVLFVMGCLAVSALGLLVLLCRALFSRRAVRTIEIVSVEGGSISVTRDAIAAQATHIVEADGTCAASRVRVDAKARGHIRVLVRVLPHETVDVVAKGVELHEELVDGLAAVCGDKVEDVSLEFVEPESVTLAPEDGPARAEEAAPQVAVTSQPAEAPEAAEAQAPGEPADEPEATSEITVPMGGSRGPEREA